MINKTIITNHADFVDLIRAQLMQGVIDLDQTGECNIDVYGIQIALGLDSDGSYIYIAGHNEKDSK